MMVVMELCCRGVGHADVTSVQLSHQQPQQARHRRRSDPSAQRMCPENTARAAYSQVRRMTPSDMGRIHFRCSDLCDCRRSHLHKAAARMIPVDSSARRYRSRKQSTPLHFGICQAHTQCIQVPPRSLNMSPPHTAYTSPSPSHRMNLSDTSDTLYQTPTQRCLNTCQQDMAARPTLLQGNTCRDRIACIRWRRSRSETSQLNMQCTLGSSPNLHTSLLRNV